MHAGPSSSSGQASSLLLPFCAPPQHVAVPGTTPLPFGQYQQAQPLNPFNSSGFGPAPAQPVSLPHQVISVPPSAGHW
jgi:hypothetical protein